MNAFSRRRTLIEPLEQRIAPALLVVGANLLGGSGNPKSGSSSIGGNTVTVVTVLSGEAIVWYDGPGGIPAISVGPNTSLDIYGDVGTIVANLTASGHLTNSSNNPANGLNGDVLLPNNITGITTHPMSGEKGSIGAIITGGSVTNLNISGNLSGVYAGTGAFYTGNQNALLDSQVLSGGLVTVGAGVDVNPILPGMQGGFVFSASNVKTVEPGASITNVKMGAAEELQMFAGDGFAPSTGKPLLAGGSISNISIKTAFVDLNLPANTPSYNLMAGNGGNGVKGGAGGSITKISEISSSGVVDIVAGQGGTGSSGAGGAGGSVIGLNMESVSSAYTVHAGKGGTGSPGGPGGSVKGVNFGGDALSSGIIVAAPFTGGLYNDVLLVDSLTGNMVVEQNNLNIPADGGVPGFTAVTQDSTTQLTTIAPIGTTPVGAVAVDLGTTGSDAHDLDIVVAYKGTESLGVYSNQGKGVFYVASYTNGVYNGDTLKASAVALPLPPVAISAGNFSGTTKVDIAVIMNNTTGSSDLMKVTGDGVGDLSVPTTMVPLPIGAVSMVTANIQGNPLYQDLFIGFGSGQIDSVLNTGSASGMPFIVAPSGTTIGGGIANLDYNPQSGMLLALNGTGSDVYLYESNGIGTLFLAYDISQSQTAGKALVAHFVPTGAPSEPVEVLSSISSGSLLNTWNLQGTSYVVTSSVASTEALKNFVPVMELAGSGVAAVGGSLEHFAYSDNGGAFGDVGLPFSGKKVNLYAGDGGDGVNALTGVAAGGAGGEIFGMNILAGDINVLAGNGGASTNAPAGAGGLVGDSPVLMTVTGQSVPAAIDADYVLNITAGTGGTAAGTSHAATGGVGGSVLGLNLSMQTGDIVVYSGNGGSGSGGAGGNAGTINGLKAVNYGGDLSLTAGNGGVGGGASGNGGAGGSILGITYSLSPADLGLENAYNVGIAAGYGGASASAVGGAGGSIQKVNMTLQPANESVSDANVTPATLHANVDSTVRVTVTAGYGGAGATGGAGGSLKGITSTSLYEQIVVLVGQTASQTTTFPEINPVVAQFTAGYGGAGSKLVGGAGGSISNLNLIGISHYDPDPADNQAGQTPLLITSGNGGNGVTAGGAGGAIANIIAQNAVITTPGAVGTSGAVGASTTGPLNWTELGGAAVISGNGGSATAGKGGPGGTITGLNIGVSGWWVESAALETQPGVNPGTLTYGGGQLSVVSGAGGNGGGSAGKGGAGGCITKSLLGSADVFESYGLLLQTGAGGNGVMAGGIGGNVKGIGFNAPQNPTQIVSATYSDALSSMILAGNGGSATGSAGAGGAGGAISQITQNKDVNSAINVIQAGNGGASPSGIGGVGGSVTNVNTVGLIGQASDDTGTSFGVFQTATEPGLSSTYFNYSGGVPQGVFAGRGGTGNTSGAAGSVTSITAAQIAAIGAAVNSSGLFAAASKVANITAESIGYDKYQNGHYTNASGQNQTPPDQAVPIDGFIFSTTQPTNIETMDNAALVNFTFVG